METQLSGLGIQFIRSARRRAQTLVHTLEHSHREPLDVARDQAAAAVEQYCAALTDELVASASSISVSGAKLKECYTALALAFAKSVRDLEPDPERRHAIAQAILFKILQSERRLRAVMEALSDGDQGAPSGTTHGRSIL